MTCGLLGRGLGHSFSPRVHAALGLEGYGLFSVEPEELADFLRRGELAWLNVTMPYKRAVMPFCTRLSDGARAAGAVNTMVRRGGEWHGCNTDIDGFSAMAELAGVSLAGRRVLLFGSGGAAAAAAAAARQAGCEWVRCVSRRGELNYENMHALCGDAQVLINATPVGMFPHAEGLPAEPGSFPQAEAALDLVYNPLRTRFVLAARERGMRALGGLSMLVFQARQAQLLALGGSGDALRALRELALEKRSLVLTGMPGCGKSTVGRLLAEALGRELLDTDELISRAAGQSAAEIIARRGEAEFRRLERAAVREAAARTGAVIALGGGAALDAENRTMLRQNGYIIWLRRELSQLATEGRPLSAGGAERLARLAAERDPVYAAFADAEAENGASPRRCAREIAEIFARNGGAEI